MHHLLPLALVLLALSPAMAQTPAPTPPARNADAAASLEDARAELGKLEAMRQRQASWRGEASTTASALRGMSAAAMKLAMAATAEEKRWPQALSEWKAAAVTKTLTDMETRLEPILPDTGDAELVATLATLRKHLAAARSVSVELDAATGSAPQAGDLDRYGRLFTALSGANQAAHAMASQLNTRLSNLDTRLILLRQQITALKPISLPAPPGLKP